MPVSHLAQDARIGLRQLLKNPGFSVVAFVTLTLGIGGVAAMFSVTNTLLLERLPYYEPERLVMVWEWHSQRPGTKQNVVAPANLRDWRARSQSFEALALFTSARFSVLAPDRAPEEIPGQRVSPNYFTVLGARPLLGSLFGEKDGQPGSPGATILSHRLWLSHYGGDPDIVGKPFRTTSGQSTIVGVMPADFMPLGQDVQLWSAVELDPAVDYRVRSGRSLSVVGRLKPGVNIRAAQTEMDGIAQQLVREYPDFNTNWNVNLIPLQEQFVGPVKPAVLVLMGALVLVLLIACANVANLLLSRAVKREREMAIRAALGAGRTRLMSQLLVESLTLAIAAGIAGVFIAQLLIRALVLFAPRQLPMLDRVSLNPMVLAFTLGMALLSGIVFGLAPAWSSSIAHAADALKDRARSVSSGLRSRAIHRALIVGELALAVMLLCGATLLLRSFSKLTSVDPGFRAENVLTMRVSVGGERYREVSKQHEYFRGAVESLRALPGVKSAAAITFLPFTGLASATSFRIAGEPAPTAGNLPVADVRIVTPGYFATLGIPLLRGRDFSGADRADAPRTFVINETMARTHFAGQDPLGKQLHVSMGDDKPGTIVGVVGDTKHTGFDAPVRPMVYYAYTHLMLGFMTFVVRSDVPSETLQQSAVRALQSIDPQLPVAAVRPLESYLAESVSQKRFQTMLLAVFSGFALFLAALGIYGVIAYTVSQRTQELGVRMAIGASRGTILKMILKQGVALAAAGVAIGLAAALMLSRSLKDLLFGIEPTDPVSYLAVAGILAAVSLAACIIPAQRATRIDPIHALRYE